MLIACDLHNEMFHSLLAPEKGGSLMLCKILSMHLLLFF